MELIAPPASAFESAPGAPRRTSFVRKHAHSALRALLLDRWEPWSARRLRDWEPDADAALLIAHPFSAVVYASRRLGRRGVPYVVDVGDPWAVTAPWATWTGKRAENAYLGMWRARRGERRLWEGAAGAIVTAPQQRDALVELFPALPVLVRPNGYPPPDIRSADAPSRLAADPSELRLVHFGRMSRERMDIRGMLARLQSEGPWERVTIAQYGDDFTDLLEGIPGVRVERHASRPWEEVIRAASGYDAAIVVGNMNPGQLPSKAIDYLTLPIPRLALTNGAGDALALYVREQPGWLVISSGEAEVASAVAEHVRRPWRAAELDPPEAEAWPSVVREVRDFFERCTGVRPAAEPQIEVAEARGDAA